MDNLEKIGYACLIVVAVCYLGLLLTGVVVSLPLGLIGLIAIIGIGVLVIKVVRERLNNKEDDYYSRNVDK